MIIIILIITIIIVMIIIIITVVLIVIIRIPVSVKKNSFSASLCPAIQHQKPAICLRALLVVNFNAEMEIRNLLASSLGRLFLNVETRQVRHALARCSVFRRQFACLFPAGCLRVIVGPGRGRLGEEPREIVYPPRTAWRRVPDSLGQVLGALRSTPGRRQQAQALFCLFFFTPSARQTVTAKSPKCWLSSCVVGRRLFFRRAGFGAAARPADRPRARPSPGRGGQSPQGFPCTSSLASRPRLHAVCSPELARCAIVCVSSLFVAVVVAAAVVV